MKYKPGKFHFEGDAPLAIAIANMSWATSAELNEEKLSAVRECLKSVPDVSLETYSRQQEQNVTFAPPSLTPQVRNQVVHLFLNQQRTHGITLTENTLNLFVGDYSRFDQFELLFRNILDCLRSNDDIVSNATGLGLRFVNVLDTRNPELDQMAIVGLKRDALLGGSQHFHHKYEFWCQTDHGRCFFRCATQHGDRVPENLGHAAQVFPQTRLRSYDNYVYHVDIFENATFPTPVDEAEFFRVLHEMHLRIDEAFLLAVNEGYLEQIGIKEDTQ